MDAVRYNLEKSQLSLQKIEIPKNLSPDDVLIEVAYSGVCGTDLHILDGEFPVIPNGVTLGHEFSGVVYQVGSNVKHVQRGDHVAVDPNAGCDSCRHCDSGCYHLCDDFAPTGALGTLADGGWATFCRVPGEQVHKLADDIPLQVGALTEPMSCLCHGLDLLGPVPMGSRILVMGAGIIGLLWLNALHVQGHRNIVVSEKGSNRRILAASLGLASEVLTPEELMSRHKKEKFQVAVDCSGNAKAIEDSLDLLANGGTLVIFGLAHPDAKISFSPYSMFKHELRIIGVYTNSFTFPKAMGFLGSFGARYLDFNKMGIKLYQLDQYREAIKAQREGSITKAIFKIM